MQQGLPVEGCVGVTVQIHILSPALLVVNIYMLCTCMTTVYIHACAVLVYVGMYLRV